MQVTKFVRDLKMGDVLVGPGFDLDARQVVTYIMRNVGPSETFTLATARCGPAHMHTPPMVKTEVGEARRIVVTPDAVELTPAQRVAHKLVDHALNYLQLAESGDAGAILDGHEMGDLRALLAPLRPKVPPTLDEALAVLRNLFDVTHGYDAAKPAHSAARALFARVQK